MPLSLPNLDDRTYEDLVSEARALIRTYSRDWTNHNPSDPGITLIELFAFLSEMLMYRLNRVTEANVESFLRLLNGPGWTRKGTLDEEIRQTVLALRRPDRAVTGADFEKLALDADPQVARARCVPRRDLSDAARRGLDRPAHMSVVVVPRGAESNPQPSPDLLAKVKAYLNERRLVTTRVRVVGPRYFAVGVRITLVADRDAIKATVQALAVAELKKFLHPLTGGEDGTGWPFGRNVYVSEIYRLLDRLSGVDFVTRTANADELVPADPARRRPAAGPMAAVEIEPDELVDARIAPGDITVLYPGELVGEED